VSSTDLGRAARHHGVAIRYTDAWGNKRVVPDETLAAIVDALTRDRDDAPAPPVLVCWDGAPPGPEELASAGLDDTVVGRATLVGEDGEELGRLQAPTPRRDGGAPTRLPYGIHDLIVNGHTAARLVSAPARADLGWPDRRERAWGLVAPLYAIRDRRALPAGDLTSLEELGQLVAELGGDAVATLPLLAELATADGAAPGQHPYAPLSRMFWNEAYLDLERLPELAPGRARREQDAQRGAPADLADLAGRASAMRPLLDEAVSALDADADGRLAAFRQYCARRPDLEHYARFRAAIELAGPDPRRWPASWRDGTIPDGAVSEHVVRRHQYAQWATDEQLGRCATSLRDRGVGLVLDLPIGCAAQGYDPWAHQRCYVREMSIGAPPDAFFVSGQCWGFPPPHPAAERSTGYRATRACLAHGLRHAAALRVDHVLGWSRLWWVPEGAPADQGAYVRYPVEEILAVACLEAWRADASLVGEDLGTVERSLRSTLARHGIAGMDVAVFDLAHRPGRRLRPRRGGVALLDTHDTATFVGWLTGADIAARERLGLLSPDAAAAETAARDETRDVLVTRLVRAGAVDDTERDDSLAVLEAVLEELGRSEAGLVLVQVEDLWAELDPHNVPGTTTEHANFCRAFPLDLEEITTATRAREILARLGAARRDGPGRRR